MLIKSALTLRGNNMSHISLSKRSLSPSNNVMLMSIEGSAYLPINIMPFNVSGTFPPPVTL